MVTINQLKAVIPSAKESDLAKFIIPLNTMMVKYGIDTLDRQRMFIAQLLHETNCFKSMEENLNYSWNGLIATFPKHFTPLSAALYARKPEKIANKAYCNRMGNGDEASGDGWKYRGRGGFMITGKFNYHKLSDELGIDLITNPDALKEPNNAIAASCLYWKNNNLNSFADVGDIKGSSLKINGGTNGLSQRIKLYNDCIKYIV